MMEPRRGHRAIGLFLESMFTDQAMRLYPSCAASARANLGHGQRRSSPLSATEWACTWPCAALPRRGVEVRGLAASLRRAERRAACGRLSVRVGLRLPPPPIFGSGTGRPRLRPWLPVTASRWLDILQDLKLRKSGHVTELPSSRRSPHREDGLPVGSRAEASRCGPGAGGAAPPTVRGRGPSHRNSNQIFFESSSISKRHGACFATTPSVIRHPCARGLHFLCVPPSSVRDHSVRDAPSVCPWSAFPLCAAKLSPARCRNTGSSCEGSSCAIRPGRGTI